MASLKTIENEIGNGNTFAFFSHSPHTFEFKINKKKKILLDKILHNFPTIKRKNLVIHSSYLINIANTISEKVFENSVTILRREIEMAEVLKVKFVVMHFGSTCGEGRQKSLLKVVEGLNDILTPKQNVLILLETMSGKGSEIGNNFEDFQFILKNINLPKKIGICWDTCHLYASGFDIKNKLDETINDFKNKVGLEKLHVIHINDSKFGLNSQKDRHANIGEGCLGARALSRIVNHPLLKRKIKILETPFINKKKSIHEMNLLRK